MLVDCTWDLYEGELSNKGCYGEQSAGQACDKSAHANSTKLHSCICTHRHFAYEPRVFKHHRRVDGWLTSATVLAAVIRG